MNISNLLQALDINFSEHIVNISSYEIANITISVNTIYTEYKNQVNDLIKFLETRPYWASGKVENNFQKLLRALDLLENSVNRNADDFKFTDIEIYATTFTTEHYQVFSRLKILEKI